MPIQTALIEKPAVFVVDDDPAVCNSLKFSLELEGFSVRTFADGPELLEADNFTRPGCLIIDYKLPGTNGLDLLQRLRDRHVSTPAILITSHPTRALRELATRAGVRIVEKPFLTDALTEEIREACKRSGLTS